MDFELINFVDLYANNKYVINNIENYLALKLSGAAQWKNKKEFITKTYENYMEIERYHKNLLNTLKNKLNEEPKMRPLITANEARNIPKQKYETLDNIKIDTILSDIDKKIKAYAESHSNGHGYIEINASVFQPDPSDDEGFDRTREYRIFNTIKSTIEDAGYEFFLYVNVNTITIKW